MSLEDVTNEDFVDCIYGAAGGGNYTARLKRYRQIAGGFEVGKGELGRIPIGFHMRKIHFHNADTGQRTSLPWAHSDEQYYNEDLTISIDGVGNFKATGRNGERVTY